MSGNLTKLALGVGITTAGIVGFAGVASAHDFGLRVTTPTCVDGQKRATVTVSNDFDDSAKVFTAQMSGGFAPIVAHGTFAFTETAPGATTGTGNPMTVRLIWDKDGFTKDHQYQLNWGTQPCEGVPATTAPPTTVPICVPGQHYSPVPPVGCYPDVATTVPQEPPVTNVEVGPTTTIRVCEDGNAPSIPVEDGSLVCPEFGGPPASAVTSSTAMVRAPEVKSGTPAPKVVAQKLPATGGEGTRNAAVGVGVVLVGAALVFATRQRSRN